MSNFLQTLTDLVLYQTTSESIISLKKLPSPCQVCLNDIIAVSLPGSFGDPKPKETVWIDSADFDYLPKRSAKNQSLHAEVSFNRKIDYKPANPDAKGTAFVSSSRRLGSGNIRVRTRRKKPPLIAALIALIGILFGLAEGIGIIVTLWRGIHENPRASRYESATPEERSTFKHVMLPLPAGTHFKISQGAFGRFTHNDPGHEYTWDFDVPYGTPVLSVEDGTVVQVFEPNQGGGCARKFNKSPHNIKVRHADGTVAQYVHIKSQVKKGDIVKRGQQIAVTAQNGFICTPQLDFGIFVDSKHLYDSGQMRNIPLLFDGLPDDGMAHEGYEGVVTLAPKIHNLTKIFLSFWKSSGRKPEGERAEDFKKLVSPAFPAFYEYKFNKWREKGKDPETELRKVLAD